VKIKFSGPKGKTVFLFSGPNYEQNLLIDSDKHFGNTALEKILLKCNHVTLCGNLNYITYTNK